jgi:hypothetical protein
MIETYPFFVTKNDAPYRFAFQIPKSHEWIVFKARVEDILDWKLPIERLESLQREGKKALIQLDLGLEEQFSFDQEIKFKSYIIALDELNKQVLSKYKECIEGIVLYKGSYDLTQACHLDQQQIKNHIEANLLEFFDSHFCHLLAAGSILGDICHRLVSFISDEIPCFLIFTDAEQLDLLKRAILFSKERFDHVFVAAVFETIQYTTLDLGQGCSLLGYISDENQQNNQALTSGILLPSDENLNSESYKKLHLFMQSTPNAYRLITEKIFNECWNELETVFYNKDAIHTMTLRMVKGFVASGGQAVEY